MEVINIPTLMATMKTKTLSETIEKLCQQQQEGSKISIFIDEMTITKKDEKALKTSDSDSELLFLLSTLRKYCYQAWVVARAGSLADVSYS